MSVWMCWIPLGGSFTATHWACKAVLVLIWLRLCAQSTVQSRDNLGGSPSGRGLGTWTGRKRADTHTARLTRRLSQITWTIRSFKRISQCKGAALESRAPDGYWSIISPRTDTCDGRRRRCFLLGCGRACDLALFIFQGLWSSCEVSPRRIQASAQVLSNRDKHQNWGRHKIKLERNPKQ